MRDSVSTTKSYKYSQIQIHCIFVIVRLLTQHPGKIHSNVYQPRNISATLANLCRTLLEQIVLAGRWRSPSVFCDFYMKSLACFAENWHGLPLSGIPSSACLWSKFCVSMSYHPFKTDIYKTCTYLTTCSSQSNTVHFFHRSYRNLDYLWNSDQPQVIWKFKQSCTHHTKPYIRLYNLVLLILKKIQLIVVSQ